MKQLILSLIFALITNQVFYSQDYKLQSLGGLSYSVENISSNLDIYHFGKNPAWLANSYENDILDIAPYYNDEWGNYSYKFAPFSTRNTGSDFIAIYNLGDAGTFKGFSNYNYQTRKENYRALTYESYNGEAYFFTDTTTGTTNYSGPSIGFSHGIRIYQNLFLGLEGNYQILDGLKNVYSYAISLLRNVNSKVGLAYKIQAFSAGIDYSFNSFQERIEASDVNLLSIQTYLWRGETNRIELREQQQEFKIIKNSNSLGLQFAYNNNLNTSLGFAAKYSTSNTSFIYPITNIETEDGYSNFEEIDMKLQGKYKFDDQILLGFSSGYFQNSSWTQNSIKNLLIWEWNYSDIHLGFGSSYKLFNNNLLTAFEYEIHSIETDSSKYIDGKSSSLSNFLHKLKLGFDYNLIEETSILFGYNFLYGNHDFTKGGSDLVAHKFTFGTIYHYSSEIIFAPEIEYASYKTNDNRYKNSLGLFLNMRFLQ